MQLREQQLTPVITDKKTYDALDDCFLTLEHGKNQVQPHVIYRHGRQVKFLLLPGVLDGDVYQETLDAIKRLTKRDWQSSNRSENGQVKARKLTLGWMPQQLWKIGGHGYKNIRTAATLNVPWILPAFFPILQDLDALIETYLPDYYREGWNVAMNLRRPDKERDNLSRVEVDRQRRVIDAMDPWQWTYTIRNTIFSTVELNKSCIFKAHEDGNNVDGTCVCITTLGDFVGGRLVLPRYGYSAELRPKDVLIVDNNHELHGNLGPLVGERYSIVAFQHGRLLGRAPAEDGRPRVNEEYRQMFRQVIELGKLPAGEEPDLDAETAKAEHNVKIGFSPDSE